MKTKQIGDINFVRCVAILTDASLEDYSTDYALQSGEKIPVVKFGQLIKNKETEKLTINKNNAWSVTAEFNNEWLLAGRRDLYNDWQPCDEDVSLIVARIKTRLREKPYLYRYKKEKISDIENFINLNYES